MYSDFFNGWVGKIDDHWSQDKRRSLFDSICSYYQNHIASGQKLFISYDHYPTSKYLAVEAATFFSERDIPIFISNRPLTTSMIQIIATERFGCGALSFTRDDYSFPYVGLKASKANGRFLTKKDIVNVGNNKKHKKQNIDWFDPIPNLRNYIETKFESMDLLPADDSLLWNAMYSPSSPILEELFKGISGGSTTEAYTLNSYENTLPKDLKEEVDFQEEIELTMEKTQEFYCQYGITTSPDLTSICVTKANNIGATYMTFEEMIEHIYPSLLTKGDVLVSNKAPFKYLPNTGLNIVNIEEENFWDIIKEKDFAIAIDSELNVYLKNELFPNQFAFLFCLIHSILFKRKSSVYPTEEIKVNEII